MPAPDRMLTHLRQAITLARATPGRRGDLYICIVTALDRGFGSSSEITPGRSPDPLPPPARSAQLPYTNLAASA
jgi:hypothetical protein